MYDEIVKKLDETLASLTRAMNLASEDETIKWSVFSRIVDVAWTIQTLRNEMAESSAKLGAEGTIQERKEI